MEFAIATGGALRNSAGTAQLRTRVDQLHLVTSADPRTTLIYVNSSILGSMDVCCDYAAPNHNRTGTSSTDLDETFEPSNNNCGRPPAQCSTGRELHSK
jgi:hypothetical protein